MQDTYIMPHNYCYVVSLKVSQTMSQVYLVLYALKWYKVACTVGKTKQSKKKRNAPIYFNKNYRTEMKLVPIVMDYCPL